MAGNAKIHLDNTGNDVIVDIDDFERMNSLGKWHENDSGYAVRRVVIGGKKQTLRLHRLVIDCPEGMVVDHLNGNRLDCRKKNLRICTQKDNANNRHHTRGYCFDKNRGKWIVRYKNKFCGRYETENEAKRAYQLAKSGQEYQPRQRQKYMLPKNIYRQGFKWGYGIRVDGHRYRKFGYATLAEALEGLELQKERIAS